MTSKIYKALVCLGLIGVMLIGLYCSWPSTRPQVTGPLLRFTSYDELANFVKENSTRTYYFSDRQSGIALKGGLDASSAPEGSSASSSPDFSTTNIQVEGVDEADIVKTDGEFIYLVTGQKVVIVKAYPPSEAQVLSEISLDQNPQDIFINGDRLVIFSSGWSQYRPLAETYTASSTASVRIYDISNRQDPLLKRDIAVDGQYWGSRMIGDFVYVIANSWIYDQEQVTLPKIYSGDSTREIAASDILYSDAPDYCSAFTTILAIDVQDDSQEPTSETLLLGSASNMYVSPNNIYVTFYGQRTSANSTETTSIYKIHIAGSSINLQANGEVPGRTLNQFSMDENQGYFRVATTTGYAWGTGEAAARNHLYVLDESMKIVGELENMAPGEQIYSARFMGNRCYLVTFQKVDPLFVIDLQNPYKPEVLGQLKITGYSDYLHPYDQDHVIGIGKEAEAAEQGNFAWYQGVKIALFDVSDVQQPREMAKYEIGDRGTDSEALKEHKAFLFDAAKNLLVIPVLLAEIDEAKYPYGVPPYAYGEYVWQGAYVFDISLDRGLVLRGTITHLENGIEQSKLMYYYSSPYSVKRSLYIGDILYTISDTKIKMNSLESLEYINQVTVAQASTS